MGCVLWFVKYSAYDKSTGISYDCVSILNLDESNIANVNIESVISRIRTESGISYNIEVVDISRIY